MLSRCRANERIGGTGFFERKLIKPIRWQDCPHLPPNIVLGAICRHCQIPQKKTKKKTKTNHLWHNINYQCRKRENEKGCGKYWAIYEREEEYTWG